MKQLVHVCAKVKAAKESKSSTQTNVPVSAQQKQQAVVGGTRSWIPTPVSVYVLTLKGATDSRASTRTLVNVSVKK